MQGFRAALAQYLIGDLEVVDLESAIDESMASGPQAGPELQALLDDLFQSGRLPHQIYALLKRRVEQGNSSVADERTQFQPPKPPPEESAAPADDATRIQPALPPGASGVDATGRTTDPAAQTGQSSTQPSLPTAGPTGTQAGQSGWSSTGSPATSAGSNWSHPSQWTGGNPSANQPIEIGSMIKGRFVLEEMIGQGGMGKVFKSLDLRKQEAQDRNPYVALKILNEDFKKHPQALQALQRESRKAQDLAHPNVVTVFDFDRDGDNVFMTMEYLEGESLDKFVKRHLLRGIAIDKAIDIVRSLGEGLAYAHAKSVVHSDFKPANAFLTAGGVVKIFDFGIARAAKRPTDLEGEKTLFDAGELGALTPAYASCEMIEGKDPDPRDDVYALAIVAYELMAGRHPFDKKSAVVARDSNMVPEPIKGLSRRQWRAILRGLAFEREQRSPSVEAFLDELSPRKLPLPLIAAAAIVLVAVASLLFVALPGYLQGREVDSIIADISNGPDEAITARLEDLRNIRLEDASLFRDVFADSEIRQQFIEYYGRRIAAVWEPAAEKYDFPRAEEILAELQIYFSDSRAVSELQEQMQTQRGEKIVELYAELTVLLEEGMMIADQSQQNVTGVLNTLRQISPQDERLSGEDIPIRFAEVATGLLQQGQITLAERVVEQGLAFVPGDIVMVNVQDSINNQRDQIARQERVAALESTLARAVTTPDGLRGSPAREALIELSNIDPGNRLVTETRQSIERTVLADLQALLASGSYADGYRLLQSFEGVASEQFLAARTAELDAVAQEYLARVEVLFGELQRAVDSDRLDQGSDSAIAVFEQLSSLGVSSDRLVDARTQIAAGYSRRAARAQQGGEWELARQHLRAGLTIGPTANVRTRLESELADLDRYEQLAAQTAAEDRERMLAEQREAEIERLQSEFDRTLARPAFSATDAREALGVVQALSDYGQPAADGERQIVDRLVGAAETLMNDDRFDEALTLVQQGNQMFPQNGQFGALLTRIQTDRVARAEAIQRRRLDDLESRIAQLIADPLLSQSWDQSVSQALVDYAAIVGEGARGLTARRTAVAELYVRDAQKQRESSRLVNAAQQLERAERYAPQLAMLVEERAALRSQEIALREQTAQRAQEAEINNQKLALEAEAGAGNMTAAVQILQDLKSKTPNDEFVKVGGPRAIARGYAALGLREASKSNGLQDAARLLEVANSYQPSGVTITEIADLQRAIDGQAETVLKQIQDVMIGDQALNVEAIAGMIESIRTAAPGAYTEMTPGIISSVLGRIGQLAGGQRSVAERRLRDAREIFPDEAALRDYEMGVQLATGDPCGRPELVGNGNRRGGSCRDALPGENNGPPLVVVPPGGPFSKAVAISKFEIAVRDYNIYCEQSGACKPKPGNARLPVTQISVQEAENFVSWLSKVSGATYRIPSAVEWEYAASANGQQPKKNFNCQVTQDNQLIKGIALQNVDTGDGNGWGLYNYVGNAQEWVRNGSGWEVRGGAYTNSMQQCDVKLESSHSGQPDKVTGFRIVRELG